MGAFVEVVVVCILHSYIAQFFTVELSVLYIVNTQLLSGGLLIA